MRYFAGVLLGVLFSMSAPARAEALRVPVLKGVTAEVHIRATALVSPEVRQLVGFAPSDVSVLMTLRGIAGVASGVGLDTLASTQEVEGFPVATFKGQFVARIAPGRHVIANNQALLTEALQAVKAGQWRTPKMRPDDIVAARSFEPAGAVDYRVFAQGTKAVLFRSGPPMAFNAAIVHVRKVISQFLRLESPAGQMLLGSQMKAKAVPGGSQFEIDTGKADPVRAIISAVLVEVTANQSAIQTRFIVNFTANLFVQPDGQAALDFLAGNPLPPEMKDRWDRPLVIRPGRRGPDGGIPVEVCSVGPDGKPGGRDDICASVIAPPMK